MTAEKVLPAGVFVIERGWLSANNIVCLGKESTALIDSGYGSHAQQTLGLVQHALAGRPLGYLLNTHLHSDHCGGNAVLQRAFPGVHTVIPPGQAGAVQEWDPVALTYEPTGQYCERFVFNSFLIPGKTVLLGECEWEIHGAPGHDPHSVILFEPSSRTLISADALWETGFGVVFPELEGMRAFDLVGDTLDLIEKLNPAVVIPGHGRVFSDAAGALARCRERLSRFVSDPRKHATHATKVLLKFKLLELQHLPMLDFMSWAVSVGYFKLVRSRFFPEAELRSWLQQLVNELAHSGAARLEGESILNS